MLKILFYIVLVGVVIGLLSGGIHLYRVSKRNAAEMSQYEGLSIAAQPFPGKTLVIYYSLSGHTKDIAERIQKMTGGDIYAIKTTTKLDRYPWFYLNLKRQLSTKKYPELEGNIPDLSQYDTIFVGSPVWWYTMATPMYAFLQKVDFLGKRVVPFSTQGSNVGTFFTDFASLARHAKLQKSASFNNLPDKYNQAVDNKIAAWLNSLN